jgi:hypothetical protein
MTTILRVGGALQDQFAQNHFLPGGLVYQLWVDKITTYLCLASQAKQSKKSAAPVQLMKRAGDHHRSKHLWLG